MGFVTPAIFGDSFPGHSRLPLVIATAGLLLLPVGSVAQTFSGTGPGATPVFVLTAGVRSIDVDATADGGFSASLLATDGSVVAQLSEPGQHDLRIPADGRYLFDVRAAGAWRIRVEQPDSALLLAARGRIEGTEAAGSSAPAGWLGKGFGAGLLLGPVGTWLAMDRAAKADVAPGPRIEQRLAQEDPAYGEAFREAYTDERRGMQRTAALVGGLTGSAILGFVILQLTVWDEEPSSNGRGPGNGETPSRVPLGIIRLSH